MNLGLSADKTQELMEEIWNPHCQPPWDSDELAIKIENAQAYAQNEPGCWAVEPASVTFAEALGSLGVDPTPVPHPAYPRPKSAAELAAGNFPRAQYIWDGFVLQEKVNLLYGDGGVGKTILTEHIAVAVAAGVSLFGRQTIQMPVLLILAEDDDGETKARLEAICGMLGQNLAVLPLTTWCLPGCDANLAHIRDDGEWHPGPFLEPLRAQLKEIGPCLLVVDTVSDIASLDENKRQPVNTLCKVVLAGLCRDFGASVIVNAHPSKSAMATGADYAGTTAWNNAVRNRLTLKHPDPANTHGPRRVLSVAKANYSEKAELSLYQFGLTFMSLEAAGQTEDQEREAVLQTVLALIDQGVNIVRGNGAGQKPKDVAKEVKDQHGLDIPPGRVLSLLNDLERQKRLSYQGGGNLQRGQRAGFRRRLPPEMSVASSVASVSQAMS